MRAVLSVSVVVASLMGCGSETSLTPDVDVVVLPDTDGSDDTDLPLDTDIEVVPDEDATTLGTEHWVAYLENLILLFNGPPEFRLAVHAPAATQVTVEIPQTGYVTQAQVPAGWSVVGLPRAILYPTGSNMTGVHGVRITSDLGIEVIALHDRAYFSEATRALPTTELGQRYRVIAAEDVSTNNRSSFIVAATQDGTSMRVTPSVLTEAAFPAGIPIELTLDAGETYQVHAFDNLTGSLIEADAPVAVFAGGADPAVSCLATSHVWEQLPPVRRWGRDYRAVPLHGQGGDLLVVVSDQDGTEVRLDCGDPIVLDAGESVVREIRLATRVTSSEPVTVGQLAKGSACTRSGLGDANMAITTPEALSRQDALMYADLTEFISGDLGRVGYSLSRGAIGDTTGASSYVDEGEVVLEGTVRGVGFAVSAYDARTFSLGYDCVDCVADLREPPLCP